MMGQASGVAPVVAAAGNKRRRKLWEIEGRWHCTIIGTCLTLRELRKLAAKAGIVNAADMTDYQLHGAFVSLVAQQGVVAKLVHKTLERKYASHVTRFARATSAGELVRLWESHVRDGDVPGPAWAVISHPAATAEVRDRAYGEVHMLSHLSGASLRADLRRIAEIERQAAEASQQLGASQNQYRAATAQIAELKHQLAAGMLLQRRCEHLEARVAELENGAAVAELKAQLAQMTAAHDKAVRRGEAAERRLAQRDEEAGLLTEENVYLTRAVAELRQQIDTARPEVDDEGNDCPNLGGRCILYVGGAHRMVPHLQALIARCNGELLYHDGGLEEGAGRLVGALSRADAIVCPISCVSHDAVDHIKRSCRKCAKPFVPLRSSGLSAFMRGLKLLSVPAVEGSAS